MKGKEGGRKKKSKWTEQEVKRFRKRTATCFAHEVEVGALLSGKIDFVPGVGLVSALE